MHLDFDTRLTVAFLAGLVGLVMQQGLHAAGLPTNDQLSYIFGGLVIGPLIEAIRRGGKDEPADPEPDPSEFWRPRS